MTTARDDTVRVYVPVERALVYPAAGLIETALRAGACVVEINPEPTPFSRFAHLRLASPAGAALPALTEAIASCRSMTG